MRIKLATCLLILLILPLLTCCLDDFTPARLVITGNPAHAATAQSTELTEVDVLTQHNDIQRTGADLQEGQLTASNVNVNRFGKLFSRSVDGYLYAQPLYARDVNISGLGVRNVVYVATEHNSVYAFDADDSSLVDPIWQVNLGPSVPSSDLAPGYHDLISEIGITGTPVIDKASGTIYLVAKTKDASNHSYRQLLHALDLSTGAERFGGPVEITASIAGTGAGNVNGQVSFNPLLELNRPGLLLLNGVVYIAFGSHGDITPYHGWVLGYDASTLQRVAVHNTSPDGDDGAIWQAGQGLAADSASNIYYITGNGLFDADQGGRDYGDSIVKLSTSAGLAIEDWFTPLNQQTLSGELQSFIVPNRFAPLSLTDQDLGSGGPLLLPGTNLLVGCGKDGRLRLVDTNNMGHYHPNYNADLQEFQATSWVFFGAPIYWSSPINGPQIYMWGAGDYLKSYRLVDGLFDTSPASQSTIQVYPGYSNSVPLSLSANGNQSGTGIVWAACPFDGNANRETVAGILRAFDADDLTKELWDSKQNVARDDIGNYAKFCPPTVANGKVYAATFSGQLQVFGLLPTISPVDSVFTPAGGDGVVDVTAPTGIAWTAVSNDPDFITIASGSSGSGDGSVAYSVAPNTGASIRQGTITVAGRTFTVYQGVAFADVQPTDPFYAEIEKLSARGITVGCGGGNYCPNDSVTREQMAAFILRATGEFNPPIPPSQRFNDVPPQNVFYNFIDRLAVLQITLGCTPDHLMYCPSDPVKRDQMAAFILRGLGEFNPPTPAGQRFNDVPPSNVFYNFIDRLAVLQITLGCTPDHLMYCPNDSVTRAQMAAFLVRAFNL